MLFNYWEEVLGIYIAGSERKLAFPSIDRRRISDSLRRARRIHFEDDLCSEDASMAGKAIIAIEDVSVEKEAEPNLLVVIPAYNEAKTIGGIVKSASQYADEVIVIDDGSTDSTAFVAKAAGGKVIRLPQNSGKGVALSVGLSTAALNGADYIVCLDADGQHDPDEIPKVCAPVLRGDADLVIGSRFLNKKSQEEIPRYRTVGLRVLTKATNMTNGSDVTDSQSGFRCLSKKAAMAINLTEQGMGIESEMIVDASKHGLKIAEVPITCKYDGLDTSTLKPGMHGTSVLASIIRSIRDEHPILYFGLGGFILTLIGISAGLYSLYQFISIKALPFIPSLVAVLFFFLGLISIFTGIILNSLSIHSSTRS